MAARWSPLLVRVLVGEGGKTDEEDAKWQSEREQGVDEEALDRGGGDAVALDVQNLGPRDVHPSETAEERCDVAGVRDAVGRVQNCRHLEVSAVNVNLGHL